MSDSLGNKKPEKSVLKQVFEASTVGIHLVLSTFFGLAIGYGLDRLFGSFPYLSIFFFIVGVVAGFREVLRVARKAERMLDEGDGKKGS
ncbi:MAG: AtpZ/AtpI family protein [Chloroflexota bacterium]